MLNAPVDLNQIASLTGLSRAELYALNPGYRGERIDPESPMRILIPQMSIHQWMLSSKL
jgi:hypothetical protein